MIKGTANFHPFVFILVATLLEVSGDALIRSALYNHTGAVRIAYFLLATALLLGYGTSINLAPVEFGKVAGLYIATLFIVWQVINFIAFQSLPSTSVLIGGALIVGGGLIVTYF
jgi:small multidrug resistance family-3 protein